MIKGIFYIIKRVIVAMLLIYTYNIILFPLGIIISINFFSIFLVSIFGLPAVMALCLFSLLI